MTVCLPSGGSESESGPGTVSRICCRQSCVALPLLLQHNAHQWMPSSHQMSPPSSLRSSPISSSATMKSDQSMPRHILFPDSISHNSFLPAQRPSSTNAWLTDQMSIFSLSLSLPQEQTPSKWSVGNAPHFFYLSPFLLSSP